MHITQNKTQLLKALHSPFATGPLASQLSRDGHGKATDELLNCTLDHTFISNVDQSAEMSNFIKALQRPKNKNTGVPVQDLEYQINSETYRTIFGAAKETTES